MYMFNGKTNDGFYDMGLAVVGGIGERVEEEGVVRGGPGPGFDEADEKMEVDEAEKTESGPGEERDGAGIPGLEGEKGAWGR